MGCVNGFVYLYRNAGSIWSAVGFVADLWIVLRESKRKFGHHLRPGAGPSLPVPVAPGNGAAAVPDGSGGTGFGCCGCIVAAAAWNRNLEAGRFAGGRGHRR